MLFERLLCDGQLSVEASMTAARKQIITDSVRQKISQLRELAKQDGLTDKDIDASLLAVTSVAEEKGSQRHGLTSIASSLWKICVKLAKVAIVLTAIFLCLYAVISSHKPSKQYVARALFNSSYPLMRALRLLTLPISRRIDFTYLYYSECAIPNPFFRPDSTVDCWSCRDVMQIPVLNEIHPRDFAQPFATKDSAVNQFGFELMKAWYLENERMFSAARDDHVESSNGFIQTTRELFTMDKSEGDIQASPFSLEWRSVSAGSVRLVRNLCGKPSFVPSDSEVQPEMFVIIESSSSYAHFLPSPSFRGRAWLSLAHGLREVSLSPVAQCRNNCTDVSLVLAAGDVLFFDSRFWQPQSFSYGSSLSIACMGSFV